MADEIGVEQQMDDEFLAGCGIIPDTLGTAETADGNVSAPATQPQTMALPLTVETLAKGILIASEQPAKWTGEKRAFWRLSEFEAQILASVYLPHILPLYESLGAQWWAKWAELVMTTIVVLGPRLAKERLLHLPSKTDDTATGQSGDSSSSAGQPEAENPSRLTDSFLAPAGV